MANTVHPVTAYARAVTAGEIVAGQLVRQACTRHLRDLMTAAARDLWFDEAAADHALEFFAWLTHSKGEWAGQPVVLQPWQIFIVGSVFGWRQADGTRRFRTAYVEVPRKNGKSTLSAGIGLYLLVADGEPGAEVYSAATKRDQARITHGEAVRMVRASPGLRAHVKIFRDNLNVPATNSKYEPLGANEDTLDGLNIHGAVIDELHAHKSRGVVDVLDTATGARRQPLIFEITTAGWDRTSVCWQHHQYSEQLLAGTVADDTWFAYIATIDQGDSWTDPAVWAKANPNYGVSVKPDDLARKCARATQQPAEQNAFKRLHLNVWTEQAERWLDLAAWDACAGPVPWSELPALLAGRPAYAGLDLASTTDIAAFVVVVPDDAEGYDILAWFWVPSATVIERTRRASVPYLSWVEQGLIVATEGNVIDYEAIKATIGAAAETYAIAELGYDPWNATATILALAEQGLDCVPIRQGFASLNEPTKKVEELVLAGRLRHGGHPVLRWMAGNVAVLRDAAGNKKPAKDKSSEKIDGITALINAIARAMLQQDHGSKYETEDLLIL